jgi:hypothetical protein
MANEQGSEKGGCCGSGCRCCGAKAVKALVLLLIGGIVGYLIGGHCMFKKGCPMMPMGNPPAATAPHK